MKYILFIFLFFYFLSPSQVTRTFNWEEAKEIATATDKKILIEFTGSTWCNPCIKMEKQVINNVEFQNFAKDRFVLFVLDLEMPINLDSKNYAYFNNYQKKYNIKVFPSYLLVDIDGKMITKIEGYTKLEKFISKLKL